MTNPLVNLTLFLFVISLIPTILLHEENQNFSEDLNKVNEEVQRVSNEVLVSIASFSDDNLGVKHDEATEDAKSNPDVSLEKQLRSEEDVDKSEPHESGQSRQESSTKIQIFSIRSHQSSSGEASKDDRGDHESSGHQGGVHHHCQL